MAEPHAQVHPKQEENNVYHCPFANVAKDEMRNIVKETVSETLKSLGIDHTEPFEVQKDMQYLREWRQAGQTIKHRGLIVLVTIVLSGFVALLWTALRTHLK